MHRLYPVTGLLALVLPVFAGDVVGHALITKRLTKKALSPIMYNLRGATPSPSSYPRGRMNCRMPRSYRESITSSTTLIIVSGRNAIVPPKSP